jgi:hypothetical protein
MDCIHGSAFDVYFVYGNFYTNRGLGPRIRYICSILHLFHSLSYILYVCIVYSFIYVSTFDVYFGHGCCSCVRSVCATGRAR